MPPIPVILAVNHNPRNLALLSQVLRNEGYQLFPALDLAAFDRAIARAETIRLALVDIAGFDERVWERCERLRVRKIPFLVLSPRQSAALQRASFSHEASQFLAKPLVIRELLGLVRSLLKEGSARGGPHG